MHRRYGYGLKSLGSPRYWTERAGRLQQSDPMSDGQGVDIINGIEIDLADKKTLALGFVAGLQLNQDSFGKCFYTTMDTVDFTQYFKRDYQKLFSEYNWYNLFVYDVVHFNGNLVASYELV